MADEPFKRGGNLTRHFALFYLLFYCLGESVFARCLSSLKDERVEASKQLPGPKVTRWEGNRAELVEHIRQALYASKIISYAQGFMLLKQAAKEYGWNLNYGGIALMWRGGCIIRRYVYIRCLVDLYSLPPTAVS